MRIDWSNKFDFEDLDLHDAEIKGINCNYSDHVVLISAGLNIPNKDSQIIYLTFKEFSFFSISCEEPWGSGIYISNASIETTQYLEEKVNVGDEKITFKLTLNSGDQITIKSSWVDWLLT